MTIDEVPQFSGVPSWFRARCAEARTRAFGARDGYAAVGYSLVGHVEGMVPYESTLDEWYREIDHLRTLVRNNDHQSVWSWFVAHLPRCMSMIPPRRKTSFINGVLAAAENL